MSKGEADRKEGKKRQRLSKKSKGKANKKRRLGGALGVSRLPPKSEKKTAKKGKMPNGRNFPKRSSLGELWGKL